MRIAIVFRPVPAMRGAEAGVAAAIRRAGHEVAADREAFDPSVDAVLIPNMPTGYPGALAQLRDLGARRPRVVVWMTEPLVPPRASGLPWPRRTHREWIKLALRDRRVIDARSNERRTLALVREGLVDAVATSTRARVERFAEVGIDAAWAPLALADGSHADLGLERDIPVLFIGALDVPRRRRMVRRLRRAGVELTALGDWHDRRYWGEGRTRLLNRAVISLNINRFPGNFPDARFNLAAANRSLIVSEPVYRPDPYVDGTTHVEAPADDLPAVIARWLDDAPGRARLVSAAYETVSTQLAPERSVAVLSALLAGEAVPAR
jgi:hypothetical protein